MAANKHGGWSRARKEKLLRLRDKLGWTWPKIAEELDTSVTNAKNQHRRYMKGVPAQNKGGGQEGVTPPDDLDVVEHEPKTDILKTSRQGRAATVEELKEMSGLGDDWQAGKPELVEWHQAYKLKNFVPRKTMRRIVEIVQAGGTEKDCYEELEVSQTGHNRVKLYSTRVKFSPVMDHGTQDCLKKWVDAHASRPLPRPQGWKRKKSEIAVNWGYYDVHVGMNSWGKETGADYDVEIALTRVLNSVDEMVERLRSLHGRIDVAYVPIGNDLGHFDGVRQTTAMGDNHLDVDTRFPRVFDAACAAIVYQIEQLSPHCNRLILMWVPGNHDTSMSYGIFRMLCARFKDWPQVEIDHRPGERKYHYWNQCLLGFDHGKLKPEAYPAIIMSECRGHLDNVYYAEMNTGHTHEAKQLILKTSVPTNGVQVRTHPTMAEPDSWHFGKGFLGAPQKSVEALYYGPNGRIGDMVVYADDDRKRDIDKFISTTIGE